MRIYLTILVVSLSLASTSSASVKKGKHMFTNKEVIALTILMEARGETEKGMLAVANVVQNRMAQRKLTAVQVCLQKKQFSCWNDGCSSDKARRLLAIPQAKYANRLAEQILAGKLLPDVTGGATSYHADYVNPYWADATKITVKISKHIFYKI